MFLSQISAVWSATDNFCAITNAYEDAASLTATFACDLFLLVFMLVGLVVKYPIRQEGIWCVLWNQIVYNLVTITKD